MASQQVEVGLIECTVMGPPVASGSYFGRELHFPLLVSEFSIATLVFDVPFEAAVPVVRGPAFEPVPTSPGMTQFILTAGDYRQTQWGSCRQMTFAYLARPASQPGTTGMFIHRLPVDDAFTCAIGHGAMDYPISIELIEVRYGSDAVTFALAVGVQPTLTLRIPRLAAKDEPTTESSEGRLRSIAYSYRRGVPYAMPLESSLSYAHRIDPASVDITLGNGPVAGELRTLGLPKPSSYCTWGEGLTATFHAGHPLEA